MTLAETTWALPCWERCLPAIKAAGYSINGLFVCGNKVPGRNGYEIAFWYLKVFGLVDFVFLATFTVLRKIKRWRLGLNRDFHSLCKAEGVPFFKTDDPNSSEVIEWMHGHKIDVLLIMVDDIIRRELLESVRGGVINKHAALLPGKRGLFPYLWVFIDEGRQGVSFHIVDEDIDTGAVLCRRPLDGANDLSMLAFYLDVFDLYPEMLLEALSCLNEGAKKDEAHESFRGTYHGLPDRRDARQFKNQGGKICSVSDLLRA